MQTLRPTVKWQGRLDGHVWSLDSKHRVHSCPVLVVFAVGGGPIKREVAKAFWLWLGAQALGI